MYVYLTEDNQFGRIKIKLEGSMWEGFKCIYQPLFLQVSAEDTELAQQRVLEQLQVIQNQVVKFILDYRNNPYLKIFMKSFHEMVKGFQEITKWLRVYCTLTLTKLEISCENFPTAFCTRLEEQLLQIGQVIIRHLPSLGIPQLFDLQCLKDFIREAEESRTLPLDGEKNAAQQLAQVIAQLEQHGQLWENRPRKEVIPYIKSIVNVSEDYVNKSLDCIKSGNKGDFFKVTIWKYIEEAREKARNFNKNPPFLT